MRRSYLVLGLGTFGARTARALYEGGGDVLAVDRDERAVDAVRDAVTRAVIADVTDEVALRAVGAFDAAVAIVAIRQFDTTVLVTHMLSRAGVPHIMVRVDSDQEGGAIRAVGATAIIFPERDMAERVAAKILMPDMAEQIPLGDNFGIFEIPCPEEFVGRTLAQLDLRRHHGVTVIALKVQAAGGALERVQVAPPPDQPLAAQDILIVLGETIKVAQFRRKME
jgi:trk system potassium uptake protein TrkA